MIYCLLLKCRHVIWRSDLMVFKYKGVMFVHLNMEGCVISMQEGLEIS